LGQIYDHRPPTRAGAAWLSPIEAISYTRPELGAEWLAYCRDGLHDYSHFSVVHNWARERTYKVNDVSRLNYQLQAAVSDLSALPYLVEVSGDWLSGTKMTLSVNGPNTVALIDRLYESSTWVQDLGVPNPSLVIEPLLPGKIVPLLVTVVNTRVAKPPPVSVNAQVSMTMSDQKASIQVTPKELQFSGIQGGQTIPYQSLLVTRAGGSPLNWNASVLNGAWIRFSGTPSGTDTGEVRVGVDITGMAAGKYNGTVRITSISAANNPVDVPVSLEVQSPAPPTGVPGWLKDLTKISLLYLDLPWVETIGGKDVGPSGLAGGVGYYSWVDPCDSRLPATTVPQWNGYTFSLDVTCTTKVVLGSTYRYQVSGNLSQDLTVIEAVRYKETITYDYRPFATPSHQGSPPTITVREVNVAQIPVTNPLRDVGGGGAVSAALFKANPTKYVTFGSASLRYTTGAGQNMDARLDWSRLNVRVATPIVVSFLK
jgi:hypothetical protein